MSTAGSEKLRLRCPRCSCLPVLSPRDGQWWCGCFCCEQRSVEPALTASSPDAAIELWNANVERDLTEPSGHSEQN
jgi:hypothetical protein